MTLTLTMFIRLVLVLSQTHLKTTALMFQVLSVNVLSMVVEKIEEKNRRKKKFTILFAVVYIKFV